MSYSAMFIMPGHPMHGKMYVSPTIAVEMVRAADNTNGTLLSVPKPENFEGSTVRFHRINIATIFGAFPYDNNLRNSDALCFWAPAPAQRGTVWYQNLRDIILNDAEVREAAFKGLTFVHLTGMLFQARQNDENINGAKTRDALSKRVEQLEKEQRAFMERERSFHKMQGEFEKLKKKVASLDWYWDPEDREASQSTPWDFVQDDDEIVEVERGGIIETRFYARLGECEETGRDELFVDASTEAEATRLLYEEKLTRLRVKHEKELENARIPADRDTGGAVHPAAGA